MAVVGAGDFVLVSFVDDNVEQLQVAVLGVGVVTLDVDTAIQVGPVDWTALASCFKACISEQERWPISKKLSECLDRPSTKH